MSPFQAFFTFFIAAAAVAFAAPTSGQLTLDYYDHVCPQALPTIQLLVDAAIAVEPRIGASLVRLHFHDCFVNLGGTPYDVLLGRRDATTASVDAANAAIPNPFLDLPALISSFQAHNLTLQDLVVLSGAHTLGVARCTTYRDRIYNETSTIDPDFAAALQAQCPRTGDDDVTHSLDDTPTIVDVDYFTGLTKSKGLLHTDQQLFHGDGSDADSLVQLYSNNSDHFWADFGTAMVKMGNLSPLTGTDGEIRENCRVVNQD